MKIKQIKDTKQQVLKMLKNLWKKKKRKTEKF